MRPETATHWTVWRKKVERDEGPMVLAGHFNCTGNTEQSVKAALLRYTEGNTPYRANMIVVVTNYSLGEAFIFRLFTPAPAPKIDAERIN